MNEYSMYVCLCKDDHKSVEELVFEDNLNFQKLNSMINLRPQTYQVRHDT